MSCCAKNMILAKDSRYAKMRENSRTCAKIKWAPVKSLLHVGYSNCTKICTITFFIGIQKDCTGAHSIFAKVREFSRNFAYRLFLAKIVFFA